MGRYCVYPMVYHKGDDSIPMKKIKIIAVMTVTVLSVLLIVTPRPISAQFVLSAWEHPDEYGQGIEGFIVYENSSGDWETIGPPAYFVNTDETYFQWNVSVFIKLRVVTWLNSTLLGLTGEEDGDDDGEPYFRHNLTVTTLGETVFSQDNFTHVTGDDSTDPPMWLYQYDVILDFVPKEGYTYTVTITYEVYY